MVLMFQKELAQRIVSQSDSKSYSRISVMCQVYCEVTIEFTISRNVFKPRPEVDSSVLKFRKKDLNLPEIAPFSRFVRQVFSQRRKKLKNNLPEAFHAGVLDKWSHMRPEQISPKEYIQIFNLIYVG